jgi:2-hydroxy-3-oxopropionate reductase
MTVAVGFIGLGQIGAPMAGHLVGHPGGLVVYDVRAEACEPFVAQGATQASSPAELATRLGAGVLSVMVRDDEQVHDVLAHVLPAAAPGLVVAIHSTIRPETAEALAVTAADHDVAVVDAPVSGGFMGAHEGRLAIMIGGDAIAVERCREPFARFAAIVSHVGPVGSGTRCKLARNLITFVSYTAAFEAQRLAEAAGIDLNVLGNVVRHSDSITGGPGAIMVRSETGPMATDDPLHDIFLHTRGLGEKDLELALELGQQLGVELPMTTYALEHFGAGLGVTGGR